MLPADVVRSRHPLVLARAGLQSAARDVFRRLPGGWRGFRRIEGLYPKAVNNAVLAAEPEHPLTATLLQRMAAMPPERRTVRFALGTHLLQDVVGELMGRDGLVVHPPPVFFPVGPEVSQHWFRKGTRTQAEGMLQPGTKVVHWYASVRTRGVVEQLDPRALRGGWFDTAFAALAEPFLTA